MFCDMESDLNFSDDMSNNYKSNLELIMKSNLLKKIIARATDNEYLVCMNVLGALRYSMHHTRNEQKHVRCWRRLLHCCGLRFEHRRVASFPAVQGLLFFRF